MQPPLEEKLSIPFEIPNRLCWALCFGHKLVYWGKVASRRFFPTSRQRLREVRSQAPRMEARRGEVLGMRGKKKEIHSQNASQCQVKGAHDPWGFEKVCERAWRGSDLLCVLPVLSCQLPSAQFTFICTTSQLYSLYNTAPSASVWDGQTREGCGTVS